MFKRRARILFIGGDAALAATELANGLGRTWLEARAQTIHALHGTALAPEALQADRQWADTVILLGEELADTALRLPQHVQRRCWPLSDPDGSDSARNAELRRRVSGLIGGLRLLAGSSGTPPP